MPVFKRLGRMMSVTGGQLIRKAQSTAALQTAIGRLGLAGQSSSPQPSQRALLRHQISARWSLIDAMERRIPPISSQITCPLCDYQSIASEFPSYDSYCIFGGGDLHRHQCPGCDLIFGPAKMLTLSAPALSQEYEWHYQAYSEGDSTESELRAFHALQPRRNGVYLNFGAGCWSRTVQILRQEGWQVFAYEPHTSASQNANSRWQLNQASLRSMRFDGIFSNNVLEHFRYPVMELQGMLDYLQPGGRMSHATACYEYLYEYTRFHLFFFTGSSRDVLLRKSGLKLLNQVFDGHFMCLVMEPFAPDD